MKNLIVRGFHVYGISAAYLMRLVDSVTLNIILAFPALSFQRTLRQSR